MNASQEVDATPPRAREPSPSPMTGRCPATTTVRCRATSDSAFWKSRTAGLARNGSGAGTETETPAATTTTNTLARDTRARRVDADRIEPSSSRDPSRPPSRRRGARRHGSR